MNQRAPALPSLPARATERERPGPLAVLLACGWLDAAAAVDPRVRVQALSRSHLVFHVVTPQGRSAIVKQPGPAALQLGRSLSRELYIYRLTSWLPELARVLARPLFIDERQQVLVLESLSSTEHWPNSEGVSIRTPAVAAQLGRSMAIWQRSTASVPFGPSPAEGILYLPQALDRALVGRSASGQHFLRRVLADPVLAAALGAARGCYRHQCLIHGDLRCDNWLLDRGSPTASLRVIDWELSGKGDPVWDLASAFAETILDLLRNSELVDWRGRGWPPIIEGVLAEIMKGYTARGGAFDAQGADLERLILFVAARLIHVGSEWAEQQLDPESPAPASVIAQVHALLERKGPAARSLRDWQAQG
jgi:Ser/Thr protein kinase RdoA (MazF antagonist)